MKKSLLVIALATATISLAFSGVANATKNPKEAIKEVITLGPSGFSGISLNGLQLNGPGLVLQGTSLKDTKLQGMELQNIKVESLKVEGGQLVAVTRVAAQ
jgi:hypothetical protein